MGFYHTFGRILIQRMNKIIQIRQLLAKEKLDAMLISSVSNIVYFTGFANFSKDEREAYLIITLNEQYIITDGRYAEAVKKEMPYFQLFERSANNSTQKLFKKISKKIQVLGVEEDELTVAEHKLFKKHFKKTKHIDIKKQRAIKTEEEINKIEQAAKLGDRAFKYILKKIKPEISEKQLAFELEFFIRKNGGELSFPAIVAFGENSAMPHHQTGERKLTTGDVVLLDFGVKFNDYCSDMTRTVFLRKPSEKQRKIYQTVLTAQLKAVNFINTKIKSQQKILAAEADKAARDYIISQGYPVIPHSLGHGIGLEVHEQPRLSPKSKDYLEEGMVFSIEPGIYLPDWGGVRIEDLYAYKKGKLEQITNSQVVPIICTIAH